MSERTLSPEIIARIVAGEVFPVLFIFADIPDAPRYYCTSQGEVVWDGHTWEGVGGAIGFETVSETTDTAVRGLSARVNGLDIDFINEITEAPYQGREFTIYLGFWDNSDEESLEVIDGPLWSGTLDTDDTEIGRETGSLVMQCEHELADQLRKRAYRYTDRDQQLLYPDEGDTGLNKIPSIQEVDVPWGRNATEKETG